MAGIKPQETQSGYLQQQYGQYGQQSNSGYGQSNDSMFTPIQSEILNFAREHQASVEGMAIKDLIFRMRGRASESQIRYSYDNTGMHCKALLADIFCIF